MPKNEEGEFELLVGNKQLLSIVFIIMVLFGIVFSMGYFVGRNSAPEAPAQQAAVTQRVSQPDTARQPTQAPAASPQAPPPDPLEPGEAKVVGTQPVSTQPAQPASPPVQETKPPETPPPAKPVESERTPATGPQTGDVFLQVAAVKKPEAELIVDVLRKRGFAALVAPVVPGQPDDALWRALVGPLKDAAAVAKARSDLQATGFKEVIVRKY